MKKPTFGSLFAGIPSAASTSASNELAGPDDGRSNGTNTASASSLSTGPTSPDTATSPPSIGAESSPSTFWPEGSLASPPAKRDGSSVRTMNGGSGPSLPEPFAHYDLGTSSWRTSQGSWPSTGDQPSATSLVIWPRSGMTLNGTAFQRRSSVPHILVTASGLWPTPNARDYKDLSRGSVFLAARGRHSPSMATRSLELGAHWTAIAGLYELAMGYPLEWTEVASTRSATRSSRKSSKSSDAA